MEIISPAFRNGGMIPLEYTCEGASINPELQFLDVPENTQSLVLLVEDPDAPTKIWAHWVVFNMPADCKGIPENSEPDGIEGISSGGTLGYEGPCPPVGEHHYIFRLFALDNKPAIPEESDRRMLLNYIKGHVIEEATLVGTYERQKTKTITVNRNSKQK